MKTGKRMAKDFEELVHEMVSRQPVQEVPGRTRFSVGHTRSFREIRADGMFMVFMAESTISWRNPVVRALSGVVFKNYPMFSAVVNNLEDPSQDRNYQLGADEVVVAQGGQSHTWRPMNEEDMSLLADSVIKLVLPLLPPDPESL